MKTLDVDKERSERELSIQEFQEMYNDSLPSSFPTASEPLLKEFKKTYPSLFKGDSWSLGKHRKKFMDWRPQRMKT